MSRCIATTRAGHPCRGRPVAGSKPPRCYAHGGRRPPYTAPPVFPGDDLGDFYGANYSVAEIAALLVRSTDPNLQDEIAAARVATRRVMQRLHQELDPAEYRRLASLVFTGANTIARLVRAQHDLWAESTEDLAGAIAEALDKLNGELGLEL